MCKRLNVQIAFASILIVLILTGCNAIQGTELAVREKRRNARGGSCSGETCCSQPYEIVYHPSPFWKFTKSKYSCCVPGSVQDKVNCCPHPLIPSKEPNVDPGFGPFCCDPETGHCCSKVTIKQYNDMIHSEPRGGECCSVYPSDNDRFPDKCCPRPLSKLILVARELQIGGTTLVVDLCCMREDSKFCASKMFNYDNAPSPRFCSPRGFCCPSPYLPLIQIIEPYKYVNGVPQFNPSLDDLCHSPTNTVCRFPQVPWYHSCIEQQFAVEVSQQDKPLYDIIPLEFSNLNPSKTAAPSLGKCAKNEVIRLSYGNPFLNPGSHSVAVNWFVTSPYVQRSKLLNETFVREKIWTWPDVIVPFIFPITIVTVSLATVLPALLLGAICWAVVFNFRFFWTKNVRMAIRAILIYIEKRQRIIQDTYLPPEDQRKFHARDRYQLPKSLQDSDRSDDDEPEDLKRTHDNLTESNWTAEEINALGFDPDNIPVDWIYGDLLGNPSALRKEVKAYNENAAKASGRPILAEDDEIMKQLDFEEWLHFLTKGQAGNKDDKWGTHGSAKLDRKRSIQLHKSRKKKIARRIRVRIRMKSSSETSHGSSSGSRRKKKHKSKHKHKKSKKKNSGREKGAK